MNDKDKPKFPRQSNPTKAADANQALIAAVSLLSASLGVAASPTNAGAVEVHTQVQTPKMPNIHAPTIHAPTPGSPKVTKTYSNSVKLQSIQNKDSKIQSNSLKYELIQDKGFQSNQNKGFQSNQQKGFQSNQGKQE